MTELLLTPRPCQVTLQSGAFAIDAATPIQIGPISSPETRHSAGSLKHALLDLFDLELTLESSADPTADGAISLILLDRDAGVF